MIRQKTHERLVYEAVMAERLRCIEIARHDAAIARRDTEQHGRSTYGDAWERTGERIALAIARGY